MDFIGKIKTYLVPYEKHTYISLLSKEQIKQRLQKDLEPKQFIRFNKGIFKNKNHKKYEGEIKEHSFTIYRILGYNNSFAPAVIGSFTSAINEKTTVQITMRFRYLPIIFLMVWLLYVFGFVMNSERLYNSLNDQNYGLIVIVVACFIGLKNS